MWNQSGIENTSWPLPAGNDAGTVIQVRVMPSVSDIECEWCRVRVVSSAERCRVRVVSSASASASDAE